jgi:hypothetical protein
VADECESAPYTALDDVNTALQTQNEHNFITTLNGTICTEEMDEQFSREDEV